MRLVRAVGIAVTALTSIACGTEGAVLSGRGEQGLIDESRLPVMPSRFVTTEFDPFRVVVRSSIDGRILRVLEESDHAHRTFDAVVSRDGSNVYFNRFGRYICDGRRRETPEIVRVSIDGGPIEPLDPPARGVNLAITPDGSSLSYNSDSTGTGCADDQSLLVRRNLMTGEVRKLVDPARDGLSVSEHSWSPDGTRLLAKGNITDGVRRLLRVDFTDDHVRGTPLPSNHQFPAGVAISNDAYAASYLDKGGYHVASFDFDGTFRKVLFDYEAAFSPHVDPSGRHFLYILQGQGKEPSILVRWNAISGRQELGSAFVQDVAWAPNGAR